MSTERRRGTIELIDQACTSCMVCVRECPVWCIDLTAHTEVNEDAGPRGKRTLVLDSFHIDFGVCMDCGICVDVCPTDALVWSATSLAPGSDQALVYQRK